MIRTASALEAVVSAPQPTLDEDAGFGVLKTGRGSLPLVAMDVRARISGVTTAITLKQTFRNSSVEPLEATYIFPLPDRAAVTSFRMKVADRIIEGELKERGQAREDYDKAIEAGHRAAIAEEERSGTFSLRVGNIPAKEQISIELTLVGPLAVSHGEATFRFPLVVAPRYVSGIPLDGPPVGSGWGVDTDQVPDASRLTPPVLLPGFPNPVHLSLEVELDPAGLGPEGADWATLIRSSLHSVIVDNSPPWTVRLQPGERLNRDFLLRFPVATDRIQATVTYAPSLPLNSGVIAVTVVPPRMAAASQPQGRDIVVVLDRSGSMEGWKITAARRAVGRMIDSLLEQDRFMVIAFDTRNESPSLSQQEMADATDRHRWRALKWLETIEARGGTELGPALEQAIEILTRVEPARQRVVVLVTDGQVGAEDAILRTLQKSAGPSMPRVHLLGIDQSVNAGFLQRLADLGGGTFDLVESEDRLDQVIDRIHHTLGAPALTRVSLEPMGFEWVDHSLAPARLPDVFPDRPVTILGRIVKEGAAIQLRVRGTDAQGRSWHQEVAGRTAPRDALLSLWGRSRLRDLEDKYYGGAVRNPTALAEQIVLVSLASHVLSRFTAYVAVDRSEVVNPGDEQRKIIQPVEMPAGCDMQSDMLQDCCLRCPPSPVYDIDSPRSAPIESLAKIARYSQEMPAPRTLSAIVDDASKLLRKMQGPHTMMPRKLIIHVHRLLKVLEELAIALRRAQFVSAIEVGELVAQGRGLLEKADASTPENVAKLTDYLVVVEAVLKPHADSLGSSPKRKAFWT